MKLGLLTNNVKEFGEHWRSTFPIDELFEVVVDSSHVGMRKPDPEIYLLTCEQLAVEPADAVFVDDNADNVAAARALGMETVHFGDDPRVALAELDAILDRRGSPMRACKRAGTADLGRGTRHGELRPTSAAETRGVAEMVDHLVGVQRPVAVAGRGGGDRRRARSRRTDRHPKSCLRTALHRTRRCRRRMRGASSPRAVRRRWRRPAR